MPAMYAYLDDFGKITIWMNKNFYGGRSDSFWLIGPNGFLKDLIVAGVEEHGATVKYALTAPADLSFGKDYKVREAHGLIVPLQIRLIVRTEEFNRMFYYDGDDLGAVYHHMHTDFALWAPTAVSVTLQVHLEGKTRTFPMERGDKGVWRMSVIGDLAHATYVYLIERNGRIVRSLDPYALSSAGNSWESAVIDPEEVKTIPFVPMEGNVSGTDAIIYETNVRDMTASHDTGTRKHGTYEALSEEGTTYRGMPTGLDYLASLGVTHIQLMPVHDFCTVDEYHPDKNYNWGYDPMQYLSLEGSYSSDPGDPYARMKEFRNLVSRMHAHGLRVNLDVVFNHLYDVDSSCFNETVPYYYFRYNDGAFLSNGSYCGNDFASDMPMARKYLIHVIEMFMRLYDVDGFRFDLMGVLDVDTMNAIRAKAVSIKPDAMIYGEGWDMPTVLDWKKKANINNQNVMPHIGHFNDYFRDVVKGKTSDDQKYERGYITGDLGQAFSMLSALSANTQKEPLFFRFESPDQSINGIETHDNSTAWDKMHACCGNEDRETRRKRQKMMILSVLISQGIPFLHAGVEYCGTKNDNSNSYNAGDAINEMDWERAYYNKDVIAYTRKAIQLRKQYPEFRFHTSEEILHHVNLNTGEGGVVFYHIHLQDEENHIEEIEAVLNPSFESHSYHMDQPWHILFDQNGNSSNDDIYDLYVPELSIMIFAR